MLGALGNNFEACVVLSPVESAPQLCAITAVGELYFQVGMSRARCAWGMLPEQVGCRTTEDGSRWPQILGLPPPWPKAGSRHEPRTLKSPT
jgi:hypothetical protein